ASAATNVAAIECGAPPQQFTDNVDAQGKAQAEGLLKKIFEGSFQGNVSVVAQDLLSKYPNADRTVIALGLLSIYCQMISTSHSSDNEKMEMLGRANTVLLKWVNTPRKPEP